MNNNQRTVIGFVIFIFFLVLGIVLAQNEEITESDDKD